MTYDDYLDYCEERDLEPLDRKTWRREVDEAKAERVIDNKEYDND